jgi:membrane protease YdiL (CAAX protease family)
VLALAVPVLGIVCAGLLVAIGLGIANAAAPGSPLTESGTTEQFVLLGVLGQFGFLTAAVLGAVLLGPGVRLALGLTRPRLHPLAWPVLFAGGVFLWAAVTLTTHWLMRVLEVEPSEHLQSLAGAVNADAWGARAALLIAAAVLPGICEEVLVRGVVQRTLAGVWPAWAAIGASSVLFALLHIDPQHVAMVASLGLWWGYVAWRTGSTWPTIGLHMLNNALAMGAVWAMPEGGWDARTSLVLIPTGLCFVAAFFLLERAAVAARGMPNVVNPPQEDRA